MNRFIKSLIFPTISILLVTLVYLGLTVLQIDKKFLTVKAKNHQLSEDINNLSIELSQLSNNLSENKTLTKVEPVTTVKKIETRSVINNEIIPEPTEITKTVTQVIEKEVDKNEMSIIIQNVGSFKIKLKSDDNAFSALQRAASENNFSLTYDNYSFGVFIKSIAEIMPADNQYWAFYYNGAFSNVGAGDQPVKSGDTTFWQLQTF